MEDEYGNKVITNFLDVFNEIAYDWELHYGLTKHEDGSYSVNKLYITPTEMSYKTDRWKLAPGVFDKVEKLYRLLYPENSVDFIEGTDE